MLPAEPWGCSTQLVSPTPSSDCSMERESSRKVGVRESSGKAGIPLLCHPGTQHWPLACSPSCLCCSGMCTQSPFRPWGLDSQDGRVCIPKIYQQQDPASQKNYQQLNAAQSTPRHTQSSVCPLTATNHVLPPTHSRHRAIPQTWPGASQPRTASGIPGKSKTTEG